MKEIVTYRYGSFNDYKGQEHKFIVCAVSQHVNDEKDYFNAATLGVCFNKDNPFYDYNIAVSKMLTFGVAVCNPIDAYNESHGEVIAYNKAKSKNPFNVIVSQRPGAINTSTVNTHLDDLVNYIAKEPNCIIPGYNEARKKFFEERDLKDDVNKMDDTTKNKIKILADSTPESIEYAKKVVKYIK